MKIRPAFVIIVLLLFFFSGCKSEKEKALEQLDYEITLKDDYDNAKEERLKQLKRLLSQSLDNESYQNILWEIIKEYKNHQVDSAEAYSIKLIDFGTENESKEAEILGLVSLMDVYVAMGYYKEALDIQKSIDEDWLTEQLKPYYFNVASCLYSGLDAFQFSSKSELKDIYKEQSIEFLYAIIDTTPQDTYEHDAAQVEINQIKGTDPKEIISQREQLIQKYKLDQDQIGYQNYKMALAALDAKNHDEIGKYLAKSAVAYIKNSNKETRVSQSLSQLMLEEGDAKRAESYLKEALDNTEFFGSQIRKVEIGAILPSINEEKSDSRGFFKAKIVVILIISLFFIFSTGFLLMMVRNKDSRIIHANRRLSIRRKELEIKNKELDKIRDELDNTLEQLKETIELKDQFLLNSLSSNSEFVNSLENNAKEIAIRIKEKRYDELRFAIQHLGVKEERQKLWKAFDHSFLKMFPTFLDDLNLLFKPEDKIVLGPDNELPVDIRIFALSRLGINDPAVIANIMNLSVKTIYVYKTKLKSKSVIPNNEFDERIMKIKKI